MIYPAIYRETTKSQAEYSFYLKAKQQLGTSKDFDVFHSVRIAANKPFGKEVEIDFVILCDFFVLCIEVKGGFVNYSNEIGWTQNNREINDPIQQIIKSSKSFINRFPEDMDILPAFWAICFPDSQMKRGENLPVSLNSNNILDSDSLNYLDAYLKGLIAECNKAKQIDRRSSQYARKHIKGVLSRKLGFEPTFENQLDCNNQSFCELLEAQKEAVNAVAINDRLVISGPAGSGKTLVGLHQLFVKYEQGCNVLFLAFNKGLAKSLGYQVRNTYAERDGQRMDITTFHSLAKRVICAHQPEWWSGQNTDSDDFWELEVPIKLDETLTATVPEYDLIVIDEAQDFLDLWIETVLRLLKPSGSVVVLMDSKQNIFNRANSLSQNSWTKFTLSTVIRQTKKLTEFVSLETKVDFRPHRLCPEGIEVLDLRTLRSDEEKQDALVSSGMLTSKSVILYVPDIELGPLNVQKLGRYQLIKQRDARANRGAIPLVSLNLFKGLEAEVVIISNYDAMNAEQQYVALTRAKSAVVLL